MRTIIGIDASRNRSGGAMGHLVGILNETDPAAFGIDEVHVWVYKSLADKLPDFPWLIKHSPPELEDSIFKQVSWQYSHLPKEAKAAGCCVMLYTDAGAFINFSPSVVMSRDMLSYEKGEMQRFGLSFAKLRLLLLKYQQVASMRKANGVIFLTNYAASVIGGFTGKLKNQRIIPHGISNIFRLGLEKKQFDKKNIRCVYVSNTSMYKHQWHVVHAVKALKDQGYPVSLVLVGGGKGKAQKKLEAEMILADPDNHFISQLDYLKHHEIPGVLQKADLFIFASSCENMPNTLIEGMAAGLPIACSNRGPMPEVLQDAGLYFDPENPKEIETAMKTLIDNDDIRETMARKAAVLSLQYSWKRCADETFAYLSELCNTSRI